MTKPPALTGLAWPTTHVQDTDIFVQLYREHLASVFNYCLYRVGDPTVAEDLTSDIFERAWKARARYDPNRARFSTWLFSIARRRVTDWQRRQSRRRIVSLDERLPSPAPDPESRLAEAEEQRRLRRLLHNLSDHDRDLIAMKFGAGMTNRQIAQVLGKSETAIGSALYRLVRRLRLQWEEEL